jgi:hypothetical protein
MHPNTLLDENVRPIDVCLTGNPIGVVDAHFRQPLVKEQGVELDGLLAKTNRDRVCSEMRQRHW